MYWTGNNEYKTSDRRRESEKILQWGSVWYGLWIKKRGRSRVLLSVSEGSIRSTRYYGFPWVETFGLGERRGEERREREGGLDGRRRGQTESEEWKLYSEKVWEVLSESFFLSQVTILTSNWDTRSFENERGGSSENRSDWNEVGFFFRIERRWEDEGCWDSKTLKPRIWDSIWVRNDTFVNYIVWHRVLKSRTYSLKRRFD